MQPEAEIPIAQASPSKRLLALDVFRGLTILAMILVNDHAAWHGWTPTDLIFPFFLFIVGTSLAYSLRKYRDGDEIDPAVYWRIVRRTAVLIFLGWFPSLHLRAIDYFNGTASSFDIHTLRLPGVLVRIALVYFATSLIVLHLRLRAQAVIAGAILLGYWAVLAWLPNPHDYRANLEPGSNLVRSIDLKLIGPDHMYTGARRERTDPEGLLSTLPAVVTALMGYWTGLLIQRRGVTGRTVVTLVMVGLACVAIGQGWHFIFPINKKIWTSSFVLLTGGWAMVALAGCLVTFDLWGWRRLARPFEIVGINAIFVFVASGLLAIWLGRWHIGDLTAHEWLYHSLCTSWLADPKMASLCYAILTVAFWWVVLWVMARLGWTIRV
jgi:predicted acyltransferase